MDFIEPCGPQDDPFQSMKLCLKERDDTAQNSKRSDLFVQFLF